MAFLKMVTAMTALVALSHAQSGQQPSYDYDSYRPQASTGSPGRSTRVPDYIVQSALRSVLDQQEQQQQPNAPSIGLELPREESPEPFYIADYSNRQISPDPKAPSYEQPPKFSDQAPSSGFNQDYVPSTELRAPTDYVVPANNFYDNVGAPVPAQDLTPPNSQSAWNPQNDPIYYYQLPLEITRETVPTNTLPKKYNKATFEKSKPLSSRPKEEILLLPVSEKELVQSEKQLLKTALNQAKVQHQKTLEAEKLQLVKNQQYEDDSQSQVIKHSAKYSKARNPTAVPPTKTAFTKSHREPTAASSPSLPTSASLLLSPTKDSLGAANDFGVGSFYSDGSKVHPQAAALHSSHGERVDFQMHGHDGPHSYKWGYDTGKGKGRQFRYEERDNDGNVKGHFGFFDKHGKLRMVHYDANPHDGYHAEDNFGHN